MGLRTPLRRTTVRSRRCAGRAACAHVGLLGDPLADRHRRAVGVGPQSGMMDASVILSRSTPYHAAFLIDDTVRVAGGSMRRSTRRGGLVAVVQEPVVEGHVARLLLGRGLAISAASSARVPEQLDGDAGDRHSTRRRWSAGPMPVAALKKGEIGSRRLGPVERLHPADSQAASRAETGGAPTIRQHVVLRACTCGALRASAGGPAAGPAGGA